MFNIKKIILDYDISAHKIVHVYWSIKIAHYNSTASMKLIISAQDIEK